MPFAVNTPKGQVRLMDLPLEAWEPIEKATGRQWLQLLSSPAATARSAIGVYEAACAHVEAQPETLTPARLVADPPIFEQVPDDLPEVFEGGIPKSEDDPETTGSSGAPDGSDGPPT